MNKRIKKILINLFIFFILSLIIELINSYDKQNNIVYRNLEIYFFDVGNADAILIKNDDYKVLIDAGNELDGENLVNYLKNEIGLNEINIVVGTHPHEDHIGGLDDVINAFKVNKILLPNVITTTKTFNDLLDSINNNNLKISIPKINQEFSLGDMKFKVIYVGSDESNLNDSSIVLRLDYGNTSYLFTGDISSKIECKILDSDINVDVLKVSHHGSNYSTSSKFLNKVNPKYAIILVGKNNTYNHPSSSILKRLKSKNVIIYRTDINGTIKLISDGSNIEFNSIDTEIDGG